MEAYTRHLTFERCFNFRDLGGYAGADGRLVQRRRLFRSMTPQHMTDADVVKARKLGIGIVIDFRGATFPTSGAIAAPPSRRLALGPDFATWPQEERDVYRTLPAEEALPRTFEAYAPYFAEALQAIAARPETNVVYHCQLGKDRTGVFSALLLKLLGVSDADIIEDYLLTAGSESRVRRVLLDADANAFAREPRLAAEPVRAGNMEAVLARLETAYGGARSFFVAQGVGQDRLDAVVEAFLEPRVDAVRRTVAGALA